MRLSKSGWNQEWIRKGLQAYEALVRDTAGRWSCGDQMTYADLFLIPQCYNALRYEIPIESELPVLSRIYQAAKPTELFRTTEPDRFKP